MNDRINETWADAENEDKEGFYSYDVDAPCCIRELWRDMNGGIWLKSLDGQLIVIPNNARRIISKRIASL